LAHWGPLSYWKKIVLYADSDISEKHGASICFILYYDQQMHNYFTNYYTPTCFDIIVPSSENL